MSSSPGTDRRLPGFEELYAAQFHSLTLQINAYPEGTAAAITAAKRRRNVRIASVVTGFAVIIIGAGTSYAAFGQGEHAPPPVIGDRNTASPSASPSPSTVPSDPGTPSASATSTGTNGTGIHGPDNLNNATLNLPANYSAACPHGPTKFSGGKAGEFTTIDKVLAADVDHDGNSDDIALISCRPGEGKLKQVVVFDRVTAGKFTTMGLVVQVDDKQVYNVDDLKLNGSKIQARVGDYATTFSDGWSNATGVFQWRTYGWTGSKFAQTSGSTSFQADKTANHLTATVSPLVFGAQVNGKRTGTMRVTVRNTGTRSVSQVSLVMVMAGGDQLTTLSGCPATGIVPTCRAGTLAAGASKTFTFTTSVPESEAEYQISHGGMRLPDADAQLRIGDQKYSDTKGVMVTFT